jgi:hypothetical protein
MAKDYSWVTKGMFQEELEKLVKEEGANILTCPGVYEPLAEHFNNEILRRLEEKRCDTEAGEDRLQLAYNKVLNRLERYSKDALPKSTAERLLVVVREVKEGFDGVSEDALMARLLPALLVGAIRLHDTDVLIFKDGSRLTKRDGVWAVIC